MARLKPDPQRDSALEELNATYHMEMVTGPRYVEGPGGHMTDPTSPTPLNHCRCTITRIGTDEVLAVASAHNGDVSDPERSDYGDESTVALHRAITAAQEKYL